MLYFEDFPPGDVRESPARTVTRDEIIAFAREFDPQPFHVDEAAATDSPFGGLIASGWHTAAIFMRLFVDGLLERAASMGSPGGEELRWLVPVRPGDVLSGRVTIEHTESSGRRPDRGTVHMRSEMVNQDGEVAMRLRSRVYFGRRPATAEA
jgi:acyl dehydratase